MNSEEITTVLKELYKISGFRISLHDENGQEIAAYPECESEFCRLVQRLPREMSRCLECDMLACKRAKEMEGTYVYKCRHGLTEAVSPLYNFGTLSGYLMMGQVLEGDAPSEAVTIGATDLVSKAELDNARAALPRVKSDMLPSY